MTVRMKQTVAGVELRRTIGTTRRWVAHIGNRTYVFDAVVGWYNSRNVNGWKAYAANGHGGLGHISPDSPWSFFTERNTLNDAVLDCIEDELNMRDWQAIRTTRAGVAAWQAGLTD